MQLEVRAAVARENQVRGSPVARITALRLLVSVAPDSAEQLPALSLALPQVAPPGKLSIQLERTASDAPLAQAPRSRGPVVREPPGSRTAEAPVVSDADLQPEGARGLPAAALRTSAARAFLPPRRLVEHQA